MDKKLIRYSFLQALGVLVYVALVSWFMMQAENLVGNEKTLWAPITFLTLLVVSVAMVGSLIFGRPVMWYIDGQKKESIKLLFMTLGFLVGFMAVILLLKFMIIK